MNFSISSVFEYTVNPVIENCFNPASCVINTPGIISHGFVVDNTRVFVLPAFALPLYLAKASEGTFVLLAFTLAR